MILINIFIIKTKNNVFSFLNFKLIFISYYYLIIIFIIIKSYFCMILYNMIFFVRLQ